MRHITTHPRTARHACGHARKAHGSHAPTCARTLPTYMYMCAHACAQRAQTDTRGNGHGSRVRPHGHAAQDGGATAVRSPSRPRLPTYVRTLAAPYVRTYSKSAGQTNGAPPGNCRSAAPPRPTAPATASTLPAKPRLFMERVPQYKCLGLMHRLLSHTCMHT